MKCTKCHTDNPDTSRFCGNCATQLTRAGQPPPELTKTLESPVHVLTKGSFVAGKYRIIDEIGRGGMGVVYRAHDESINRDVAIKVLPPEFASDPDRLRRFEQEARAAGQLNHPNILVVYDVGAHEGAPYIITELLEGESLRDRLRSGSLPARKAVETTVQIAQGLAAAHEKHIIHRDLKPDNIFIMKDGHAKILDFGLAKLAAPRSSDELAEAATLTEATQAGMVLGTVGYMSPEQVLGKPLDARSDLFSLGVMLYEMLSGDRPFHKGSAPETMAAILKEEPPDLAETGKSVPPGLDRIVRHCLEKEPSSRFQSARDVSFALESLSQSTTATTGLPRPTIGKKKLAMITLGVILLAASYAGLFLWTNLSVRASVPSYKRITLRHGTVLSARFTPDFQSVVYSAAWGGKPAELFMQRVASADARPLGVSDTSIKVVGTAGGSVAVVRGNAFAKPLKSTLAQLPLEGGTSRDLLKDVTDGDWDRNGTQFAVVRIVKGRQRLEYPVGKVLLETTGLEGIASPSISPDGTRIAFVFHPNGSIDPAGDICVVDLAGRRQTLSKGWLRIMEGATAWSPDGQEVWFSATRTWSRHELNAVTLSGHERLVARLPENLVLQDIASDGRVLIVSGQNPRLELRGRMAGDAGEQDLSWLDGTVSPILAPDGTQMVFQEVGDHGGSMPITYHWRVDGSLPKRIGEGTPCAVSPDWTTALVWWGSGLKDALNLVPTGAGETRTLARGSIHTYFFAVWHPDGKRIVSVGSDAEGQTWLFVQDASGGLPQPFARLGGIPPWAWLQFTPDGRFIAAIQKEGEPYVLLPIGGGEARLIPFLKAGETPVVFGDDSRSLFLVDNTMAVPMQLYRLDLISGKREPWLELAPPDRTGVLYANGPWLTANGRFYAYNIVRQLSDLFLVEGLK